MNDDATVREVRQAGEALAREANFDIGTFFANLRGAQQQYSSRLATRRLHRRTRELIAAVPVEGMAIPNSGTSSRRSTDRA